MLALLNDRKRLDRLINQVGQAINENRGRSGTIENVLCEFSGVLMEIDTAYPQLPCPRLEFRWTKKGATWFERECVYSLVIPLSEHDIRRGENKERSELTIVIGTTTATGGNGMEPIASDGVETPFRDYAHAQWDCQALGGQIPIVAVCEHQWTAIPFKPIH